MREGFFAIKILRDSKAKNRRTVESALGTGSASRDDGASGAKLFERTGGKVI